jgi:hypothetical protein
MNVGIPSSYELKAVINLYLGKKVQVFSVVVKGKTAVNSLLRKEFVYSEEVMSLVLSTQLSLD